LQNFIKNNLCKVSRRRARDRDRDPSRPRPRPRRDLRPSRPRPRLQKTGLETRLETETKSRDSITDIYIYIKTRNRSYTCSEVLNPVQDLFQVLNSLSCNFTSSCGLYFQARTAVRLLMLTFFRTKMEPIDQVKSNLS